LYGGSEPVRVASGIGIFVTLNPSYLGRRELPTNLSSLFRPLAMTKPDSKVICEVSLRAHGFTYAGSLSGKLVSFFDGLSRLLPLRSHYDFGLRSLKHAIAGAGALLNAEEPAKVNEQVQTECIANALLETIKPRLIAEDARDFTVFMETVFPSMSVRKLGLSDELAAALRREAEASCVELNDQLLEKIAELHRMLQHRPAVMLLGPSGCGKTTAWRLLHDAMRQMSLASLRHTSNRFSVRVIDPKLLTTSQLFGSLDPTTREWSDGIFTQLLRQRQEHIVLDAVNIAAPDESLTAPGLVENTSPSTVAHHWIVFDGDVDPDWAENLNSVLDDNRTLTLPNGERIPLPASVRILFEAEQVCYANPSTISRCGMICFSSPASLFPIARKFVLRLGSADPFRARCADRISSLLPIIVKVGSLLQGVDSRIMEMPAPGGLQALFSSFDSLVTRYMDFHGGACEDNSIRELESLYVQRSFLVSASRGMCGSASREDQARFSAMLFEELNSSGVAETLARTKPSRSLCDVTVDPATAEYISYTAMLDDLSSLHVSPAHVGNPDIVIPTASTLEHTDVLADFIRSCINTMVVLCGPPGCGKSMIVADALRSMPDVDVASISFSAATSPADILATIKAHAVVQKLPNGGLCLRPKSKGSQLVLFCDEVNLGRPDKYGTQTAACFLRQLIEQKGFWNSTSTDWIAVEGLRIVAACNPPELAGRQQLPSRLLRHSHVVRADPPAGDDLFRIYGALTASLLRGISSTFEEHSFAMTAAMIQLYESNREQFSPMASGSVHPHYVYSPRDISRWLRGMREILINQGTKAQEIETHEELLHPDISKGALAAFHHDVKSAWPDILDAFAHEARRLFKDRLVSAEERSLFEELLVRSMADHLPLASAIVPDRWYSSWPSKRNRALNAWRRYCPVENVEELRKLVYRKLRSFCDEEGLGGAWMSGSGAGAASDSMIDQFAVTNDVLKHLTRIERVLRLPIGHAVLVGAPGSGKKTLTRFAAWMEGMSVHQIRSHAEYSTENFADDLRNVLRLAGVAGDPIVLIFDESNALDGDYLEMMNAILACGDVPGLFEGEIRSSLLSSLRKHISDGSLTTDEALYERFVKRVQQNLHVVFTLSCDLASRQLLAPQNNRDLVVENLAVSRDDTVDTNPGLHSPGSELLTRSPALYNRCIVNWIGDWDEETLTAVADLKLEVSRGQERTQIVEAAVEIHLIAQEVLASCAGKDGRVTPRHYLEFVEQLNRITLEKGDEIQEGANRLQNGLSRLRRAGVAVDELKESLREKADTLASKETEANLTLTAMAKEQGLAERAKVDAEALAKGAERAADAASRRQESVSEQLSKVEPKVEAARQAVGSIRKENLEELRAMPNPPASVRLAIEGVMTLLDFSSGRRGLQPSWSVMRSRMRGADFISSILNFDPDAIPSDLLAKLEARLVNNPDFDVDRIYYSSRAAGPLAEWALASLDYAAVSNSVAPLRVEVARLEESWFKRKRKQGSRLLRWSKKFETAGMSSEFSWARPSAFDER
jgi:dynein heavy chain 1, cytosolic